nr:MAG TPA_asm: hypothetical protein [Caudoviricetes sp.]
MGRKRKFTWDAWDYDCDGSAYIIAKDECPRREDVPDFIVREDHINPASKPEMVVQEGWLRYECRTDWEECYGGAASGYVVHDEKVPHAFPVWIVRQEEWY